MRVVTPSEGRMIEVLDFVLGRVPASQALAALRQGGGIQHQFSQDCLALVRERLGRGVVLALAREGGWVRRKFLHGEAAVEGRLWQRTPGADLGLTYTGASLEWLAWLAAVSVSAAGKVKVAGGKGWQSRRTGEALGDQVLLFLSYRALRGLGLHGELGLDAHPRFLKNGLCRLAYPGDFVGRGPRAEAFGLWVEGTGAAVLEALQDSLRERWLEMEWHKGVTRDPEVTERDGERQGAALAAFGKAAQAAGRPDLAGFLLEVAARRLTPSATAAAWLATLEEPAGSPLARRLAVRRAALTLPRYLGELQRWQRAARATGYFDEGYAAAQLWLQLWERWDGDALAARAAAILRSVDPLLAAGGPS